MLKSKLKADAQKVVGIISSDKAKTNTFCQMAIVRKQIDEAIQEKDNKKAVELSQKLTDLEKNLGSEYPRFGRVSTEHGPDFKRWSGDHLDIR